MLRKECFRDLDMFAQLWVLSPQLDFSLGVEIEVNVLLDELAVHLLPSDLHTVNYTNEIELEGQTHLVSLLNAWDKVQTNLPTSQIIL